MHDTTLILIEVGAMLLGMSVLARVASRYGVSPIPLYLIVGLAFGNDGLLPLEASQEFFEVGSEIGVILLLALLGLEYTADELFTNLKRSRISGVLDALANAVPGALCGWLLGWSLPAIVALAGVTWISSSGVVAKLLRDLGRLSNRETPQVLAILVIEDLAMAFYLPVLSALLVGLNLWQGAFSVALAVGAVSVILWLAARKGLLLSRVFQTDHSEALLLGVLGATMLVAGLAEQVHVSAAVGAFLVGIALSGQVAQSASLVLTPLRDLFAAMFFVFFGLQTGAGDLLTMILPAALLAVVTIATKTASGYLAARRAGIGRLGRWRAGLILVPRGEFSIIIAGLAVATAPGLAPLATGYVLITVIAGTLLARMPDAKWFRRLVTGSSRTRAQER